MAKKLYGGKEIRPLEEMMQRFVMDYSVDITTAFNGLLDYIIGYFDPTGAPVEGWPFRQEQNRQLHAMMFAYIQIMDEQLARKRWFDAWGDLFMALYANGADKNQFFTPPSLVDMMTELTMDNLGEPTMQANGFGRRHIINDPSCGSSRNLLAAYAKYKEVYDSEPYLSGEDIDSLCCKMSAVNMMVHGCYGEVVCHNTLAEPDKVRLGFIVNETMYPIPNALPSIRRSNDPTKFVATSSMLMARRRVEEERKAQAAQEPAPAAPQAEKRKEPVQLKLF